MKTLLITQARIGSSRLPMKVLKEVNGKTFLEIHLERIKKAKEIDKIIVATTFEDGVEEIISIANKLNIRTFQGSTDDVLDRYYQAAKNENPDFVVRVTSDCPLIDPSIIDQLVKVIKGGQYDYAANNFIPTFPHGFEVEVMTFKALEQAWHNARDRDHREHVTPYIRINSDYFNKNFFKAYSLENMTNYSYFRITLDYEEDLNLLKKIIELWGYNLSGENICLNLEKNPQLLNINKLWNERLQM